MTDAAIGAIRQEIWTSLLTNKAAAYPLPPYGHHPNFKGASTAASNLVTHLLSHAYVRTGDTVLAYPDYVLKPLRKQLLDAGINIVVPAKYGNGYRYLQSGRNKSTRVSSIAGAEKFGEFITDVPDVQLIAMACVAINDAGDILGKGYGFRVPEALGHVRAVTIAHALQLCTRVFRAEARVTVFATPEKVKDLSRLS